MKTVVMIAPIPAQVRAARDLGLRTIVVWDLHVESDFYKDLALEAKSLADIPVECNLNSADDLLACLCDLEAKGVLEYEIFFGGIDQYFQSYFEAGTVLGKVKNSAATIDIFADKRSFRKILESSPSLRIQATAVAGIEELKAALTRRDGPVIVKPARSSGSKDIHLVASREDEERVLRHFVARESVALLVEEFFDGPQFSVEAVTVNGEHRIIGITQKFPVLPPNFVEVGGVFPAQITPEEEAILHVATFDLLNLTGVRDGATHTEVILSNRRAVIVESHLRVGGLVPFLVEASLGISLYELTIRALFAKEEIPQPIRRHVSILSVIEFEAGRVLAEVKGRDEVAALPFVRIHNIWARPGQLLCRPECNSQRHGYIVVSGETLEKAQENLRTAVSMLRPRYEDAEVVQKCEVNHA